MFKLFIVFVYKWITYMFKLFIVLESKWCQRKPFCAKYLQISFTSLTLHIQNDSIYYSYSNTESVSFPNTYIYISIPSCTKNNQEFKQTVVSLSLLSIFLESTQHLECSVLDQHQWWKFYVWKVYVWKFICKNIWILSKFFLQCSYWLWTKF